ncbi:V-type ATP synthase subunit D [Parendozoicomonas haliclonae]|uniref:V-type ATP synthase subunit D n=1 Tax=Parendozoicomonas haliclonae TaxID=1960125 RepID=A0A1X7AI99_9GAMM|nr:V-type ATP synthase subunit D [Parendozoicomonas haliclonae]SMA43445.1 V-type ATP synthase subunit D [Parendozoicomonas haliclonae]
MATKVSLNKSSLNKEKASLKTFNRYLPALELKRQQLMAERKKAEIALTEARERIEQIEKDIAAQLPMLACEDINVDGLVTVTNVVLGEQNIVGTSVPVLEKIEVVVKPYSYLTKPHWVDFLVEKLKEMAELHVESQVRELRYQEISAATRTTSQRVNLFSKVLIPQTKKNIARIKIFLSDQDRAGVVNAKISKSKMDAAEALQAREREAGKVANAAQGRD